jgi:hypothetical protein
LPPQPQRRSRSLGQRVERGRQSSFEQLAVEHRIRLPRGRVEFPYIIDRLVAIPVVGNRFVPSEVEPAVSHRRIEIGANAGFDFHRSALRPYRAKDILHQIFGGGRIANETESELAERLVIRPKD